MKLLLLPLLATALTAALPTPPGAPRPTPPPFAATDSTAVRLLYGDESAALDELMGQVLHIEKHRLELHDRRLAGRRLHLTLQEYTLGIPGPEKELTTDASLTQLDSAGRFRCTIYTRRTAADQVENEFMLPRASITKTFAVSPSQATDYSLRFDMHRYYRASNQTGAAPNGPAKEFRLPLRGPAVLAVYTLPYEKDGWRLYCGLAQSRVPVAEWYARFRVPHYVVYRVRVE